MAMASTPSKRRSSLGSQLPSGSLKKRTNPGRQASKRVLAWGARLMRWRGPGAASQSSIPQPRSGMRDHVRWPPLGLPAREALHCRGGRRPAAALGRGSPRTPAHSRPAVERRVMQEIRQAGSGPRTHRLAGDGVSGWGPTGLPWPRPCKGTPGAHLGQRPANSVEEAGLVWGREVHEQRRTPPTHLPGPPVRLRHIHMSHRAACTWQHD